MYKVKSHNHAAISADMGKYCKICSLNIPNKDHHCVWIDACISMANMKYFLSFLICIFSALIHAGLIMLTSVCLPLSDFGPLILIPDRWCQRWNTHFEGNTQLTWTAGIHCFLLALPVALLLAVKGFTHLHKIYYLKMTRL